MFRPINESFNVTVVSTHILVDAIVHKEHEREVHYIDLTTG